MCRFKRHRILIMVLALLGCGIYCHEEQASPSTQENSLLKKMSDGAVSTKPPSSVQMAQEKSRVMALLAGLPKSGKMMVGQQLGLGYQAESNYSTYVDKLGLQVGASPAVVGVDYGWDSLEDEQIQKGNAMLLKHWKRGGVVTVVFHPSNPFNGGNVNERSDVNFEDLLKKGSPSYLHFQKDLDAVAKGLQELRDAGVIVIFRPLHEPNGDWFWWGPAGREPGDLARKGYIALYRSVWTYLVREQKLDNLIFAWAANYPDRWGKIEPVERYYPGDDVVDLVGLDFYDDEWDDVALGKGEACKIAAKFGKPIVWEVGSQKNNNGSFDARKVTEALKKYCPSTAYFLFWNGWQVTGPFGIKTGYRNKALAEISCAKELLNDPAVISLEKLSKREKVHSGD